MLLAGSAPCSTSGRAVDVQIAANETHEIETTMANRAGGFCMFLHIHRRLTRTEARGHHFIHSKLEISLAVYIEWLLCVAREPDRTLIKSLLPTCPSISIDLGLVPYQHDPTRNTLGRQLLGSEFFSYYGDTDG